MRDNCRYVTYEDTDLLSRDRSDTRQPARRQGSRFFGYSSIIALALGLLIGTMWQSDLIVLPVAEWTIELTKTLNNTGWLAALAELPAVHALPGVVSTWPVAIQDYVTNVNIFDAVVNSPRTVLDYVVYPVVQGGLALDSRLAAAGAAGLVLIALSIFAKNLLIRRIRVYGTAARVFGLLKYMKSTEHWRAHLTEEENEAEWNKVHARLAELVLCEILELKGFWVKAGQ